LQKFAETHALRMNDARFFDLLRETLERVSPVRSQNLINAQNQQLRRSS
jgi:hypothetical protein